MLLADPDWEDKAIEVLYRPFDKRWAYYSKAIMERTRLPFMENMMQENVALAIGRAGQATGSKIWDVAFITDAPTDLNLFRRGGAMIFPLYSYKDSNRRYNIVQDYDSFFYYIYAILFSQAYRERYSEFLNIDYPRIPIPNDKALIPPLADLGKELANVHRMKDTLDGEESERPLRIGGWDIPGKYLADRRRELGNNELATLVYIRKAVRSTLELQNKIDSIAAQVFYSTSK